MFAITLDVRPYLTKSPIGVQGIALDWLAIEAFEDYYKSVRGRSPMNNHAWRTAGAGPVYRRSVYTIFATRLVIDFGLQASASRIVRNFWDTRHGGSRDTTLQRGHN